MNYKRLLIICTLCITGTLVWGQQTNISTRQLTKAQLKELQAKFAKQPSAVSATSAEQPLVLKQAKTYLHAYYGRTNFNAPEWKRVQNFLTWLTQNQTRLDQQFQKTMGEKWNRLHRT